MKKLWLALLLPVAVAGAGQAHADVITADSRGSYAQTGDTSGGTGTAGTNYILGNCGPSCSRGEFRDYFQFALPASASTATSAVLSIGTGNVILTQSPTLQAQFSSLSGTPSFASLAGGTAYATQTYSAADANTTIQITLNAAALADIRAAAGSEFEIGGRVISPTTFGPTEPDQFVYGGTGPVAPTSVTLTLTSAPVPEPGILALLGTGLLCLYGSRRARRT